jgi:hypothetical protein
MTPLLEILSSQVALIVAALAGLSLTTVAILRDLQARRPSLEAPSLASVSPAA